MLLNDYQVNVTDLWGKDMSQIFSYVNDVFFWVLLSDPVSKSFAQIQSL
jgi:hypothetical protein